MATKSTRNGGSSGKLKPTEDTKPAEDAKPAEDTKPAEPKAAAAESAAEPKKARGTSPYEGFEKFPLVTRG